jgi:polar amino acid transport system substrate-binding protein
VNTPHVCRRRRTLAALLAGAGLNARSAAPAIRMVSDAVVPYVMPAGHPLGEGIDVDIARQALLGRNLPPLRLEVLPWRRALALLERGQADLAPAVRRTPEREAFLHFSQPYGTVVQHMLVSRAQATLRVRRLQDLRGLRVGLVQGYAYPVPVLEAIGPAVELVNDKNALLRMAAAGRFDAALISVLTGAWAVHELGLAGVLRRHPLVVEEGLQTQYAVSRASVHARPLLEALNRSLAPLDKAAWQRFERPYIRALQAF